MGAGTGFAVLCTNEFEQSRPEYVMPVGYRLSDVPSRYQPLADYLANCTHSEELLTLTEIEVILGRPLADAAHVNGSYWAGRRDGIRRVLDPIGWQARLDIHNRRVIFTRMDTRSGSEQRMPKDGKTNQRRSSYRVLRDHLAANCEPMVVLTLAQIEVMIGRPLAASAYVSAPYWNGMLRGLGWRARLDRKNQRIIFSQSAAMG